VLLVLPLAVAFWAFAGWDSGKKRSNADARLQARLQIAVTDYARILGNAEQRVRDLASSPRVQRALARRDRRQLARLAGRDVSFTLGHSAGSATPDAAVRRVEVVARGRTLGWVIVKVPFDRRLLAQLEHASGLPEGGMLSFARGEALWLGAAGGQTRWIDLEGASTLASPEVVRLIEAAIALNRVPFAHTGRGSVVMSPSSAKKRRPA